MIYNSVKSRTCGSGFEHFCSSALNMCFILNCNSKKHKVKHKSKQQQVSRNERDISFLFFSSVEVLDVSLLICCIQVYINTMPKRKDIPSGLSETVVAVGKTSELT